MTRPCPECGEEMVETPPYPAEPEVNSPGWRGGWDCPCGFAEELEERNDEA